MTTFTASEVRELVGTEDIIARARVDKMLHAFADRLEADERATPVMWVDPTTFCDAYPFCIKKLSFMSSDDEDAGVEYVALYTHSVQAQPPTKCDGQSCVHCEPEHGCRPTAASAPDEGARDAARYRWLRDHSGRDGQPYIRCDDAPFEPMDYWVTAGTADACIDRAMAKEPGR